MRNYSRSSNGLLQQLHRGGTVTLVASGALNRLSASDLSQAIANFSRRKGLSTDCVSLTLTGFYIDGDIDLEGQGLEGSPVIGLEFIDCDLGGDFKLNYAYLKSLRFVGKQKWVTSGSILARGITIIDMLRLQHINMIKGRTLDLSESRLKAGAELIGVSSKHDTLDGSPTGLVRFSLARAIVGSDMEIRGLHVKATGMCSFDAEELTLAGSLTIGCLKTVIDASFSQRSDLAGELNLQGARIGGKVLFEGLKVTAHDVETLLKVGLMPVKPNETLMTDRSLPFPVFAIKAEEAVIGGDLTFVESDLEPDPRLRCLVKGQIDLTGLRIGGDLYVYGYFRATQQRIRAFRASRINIKGDLRFGYAPWQDAHGKRQCVVLGECDFSGAEIGGKAVFSGSTHNVTRGYKPHPGLRREQKQAIHLKGSTIGSDLWFESAKTRTCKVQGLTVTGATVGGRLLIRGVEFRAPPPLGGKQPRYKSLSANGSTIHGGIMITAQQLDAQMERCSTFTGGIRLRNSIVDGPVQFESVDIRADGSGCALWAGNTRFGSDVLIQPSLNGEKVGRRPYIRGELRFQGAHVRGRLWIQGVDLEARESTGVALDCFTAEVDRSVTLGSFCPNRVKGKQGDAVPSHVVGLVSLVHLKAQSVTIGANIAAGIDDKKDMLSLTGAILMRDCRLQSTVYIVNACLKPTDPDASSPIHKKMQSKLEEWGVFRKYCIVHANYAILGTRLFVRLLTGSSGLISLYGAKTGTIGAITGTIQKPISFWNRLHFELKLVHYFLFCGYRSRGMLAFLQLLFPWVHQIRKAPKLVPELSLRENWGEPLTSTLHAKKDVLLNLDEFTYDRTNDYEESSPRYTLSRDSLEHFAGRPTPNNLRARFGWLTRIVDNPGAQEEKVVSAHRQLARVYRDMGKIQLSYYYTRERRWIQMTNDRPNNLAQWVIDVAYSMLSGFGYSSKRALASLIVLYFLSVAFVTTALLVPSSYKAGATRVRSHAAYLAPVPALYKVGSTHPVYSGTSVHQSCVGSLCEPSELLATSSFHLPQNVYINFHSPWGMIKGNYDVLGEAGKLILPLPHLGEKNLLSLCNEASLGLRAWSVSLTVASWILFPLALGTFTGILRENF